MKEERDIFSVELADPSGILPELSQERVVFHGVNKSGSLAMAKVLRGAYFRAGRAHQFFSHYHRFPHEYDALVSMLANASAGHLFAIGHNLFRAIPAGNSSQRYVTQIRHPLPRLVSCWQWKKERPPEHGSEYAGVSIEEYLRPGQGKTFSQIAQFAVGFAPGFEARRKAMTLPEMFERAVIAFEQDFAWFGVAELFEESIFSLSHALGLRQVPAWKRDDRSPRRALVSSLPGETAAFLRDLYEWDFKFYEWAKNLFLDRFSRLDVGQSLGDYRSACAQEYKERV